MSSFGSIRHRREYSLHSIISKHGLEGTTSFDYYIAIEVIDCVLAWILTKSHRSFNLFLNIDVKFEGYVNIIRIKKL